MTYVALHRGSTTTVSTNNAVIPARDLHILQSSLDLARLLEEAMDKTQERIEFKLKSAQAEGYEDGFSRGLIQGRAAFSASLAGVAQELLIMRRDTAKSVATLAVRIVKHIALSIGSEHTVAALIDTALDECLAKAPLTIRVHPANVDAVEAAISKRMNESGIEPQLVKVKIDEALQEFECFIDSLGASVVASLDIQLQRIEHALNEELKTHGDPASSINHQDAKRSTSQPGSE